MHDLIEDCSFTSKLHDIDSDPRNLDTDIAFLYNKAFSL